MISVSTYCHAKGLQVRLGEKGMTVYQGFFPDPVGYK
jgi:hypothetical protein